MSSRGLATGKGHARELQDVGSVHSLTKPGIATVRDPSSVQYALALIRPQTGNAGVTYSIRDT